MFYNTLFTKSDKTKQNNSNIYIKKNATEINLFDVQLL